MKELKDPAVTCPYLFHRVLDEAVEQRTGWGREAASTLWKGKTRCSLASLLFEYWDIKSSHHSVWWTYPELFHPGWCRWKHFCQSRTYNPKKTKQRCVKKKFWTVDIFFRRLVVLTSNHSVAPTFPYSPALQLANTMLLLGLNLSREWIITLISCRVIIVGPYPQRAVRRNSLSHDYGESSICYRSPPYPSEPWPAPSVQTCPQRLGRSLCPRRLSELPGPRSDLWTAEQHTHWKGNLTPTAEDRSWTCFLLLYRDRRILWWLRTRCGSSCWPARCSLPQWRSGRLPVCKTQSRSRL